MKRFYLELIKNHFLAHKQMLFLMGPRQVGKTTIIKDYAKSVRKSYYFNWDNQDHRALILEGPNAIMSQIDLKTLSKKKGLLLFDEIQKYKHWKNFLKGIYDTYSDEINIVVTGSARLDIFQKGGDSLMGRYFPYYIHPFSVSEILGNKPHQKEFFPQKKISQAQVNRLWTFGGFPDPFVKKDRRFFNRWRSLRNKQLIEEEIRDLTKVHELDQIEVLANLLKSQVGQLMNYTSLSKKIKVSDKSIRAWLSILSNLCYCFSVRPWHKNVSKALVKNPKYYLWDWTLCEDDGAKIENFVASHLLKAVHYWTNDGFGEYELYFIRDKNQQKVDFLIVKDLEPWCLIEVKKSHNKQLSQALKYYTELLNPKFSFQVVFDMPYIDKDCFKQKGIKIVPLKTFLSQLI